MNEEERVTMEMALMRLNGITDGEEGAVTLRIQYEPEREKVIAIPQTKLYNVKNWKVTARGGGLLAGKAFRLNDEFDWVLGKDDQSILCLVPTKKKETRKKEEVVKQIKIKTEVWDAIEKEAKIYKHDPLELVGSILYFHYANVIEE